MPIRTDGRVLGATLKAGRLPNILSGKNATAISSRPRGSAEVNGLTLNPRDGAAIHKEAVVRVRAIEDTELVLVDAV